MKVCLGIRIAAVVGVVALASIAQGETVSYTADFQTSKGNPVYDILILEADAAQQVHATIYPYDLPGIGMSTIHHNVGFTPVKTLVIGLTEGKDTDGSDKTQIIMLLDSDFAAANVGVPFSSIFVGTRHSTTIANLQAAVSGDLTQLAWFTDTFFPGPAAAAAFDSTGPFTVAEFTSLTIDGANAVFGNWMINSKQTVPFNDINAIDGRATEVINETAKGDTGPFDIAFSLMTHSTRGQFAIDKTVVNNTSVTWRSFEMQLGSGSGAGFVPSTTGDSMYFVDALNIHEATGAFPSVQVQEDRIVFTGSLPPGGSARFIVFVGTTVDDAPVVTLRQLAVGGQAAPVLDEWALAMLAALLAASGWLTLRRPVH